MVTYEIKCEVLIGASFTASGNLDTGLEGKMGSLAIKGSGDTLTPRLSGSDEHSLISLYDAAG